MGTTKSRWSLLQRRSVQVLLSAILLVLGYPVSFGPACWVLSRIDLMKWPVAGVIVPIVYQPVAEWIVDTRGGTRSALNTWIGLGFSRDVKLLERDNAIVWVTPTYGFTVISVPKEPPAAP